MNITGRPVFGITHDSRCAHCGRTYGKHAAKDDRCPKVIDGKVSENTYTRTKFKPIRLVLEPHRRGVYFYAKSFSKHV